MPEVEELNITDYFNYAIYWKMKVKKKNNEILQKQAKMRNRW